MPQVLTDTQRKLIHDLALDGRALLTRDARELLEGTYGLYPDGRLEPAGKLPQVQSDPETGETYRRLAQFLADEERAGLPRPEAVTKLIKEIAFTHLNRLVAFKMMEARQLIRGTLNKGLDSNAFKFYLADPAHAEDYSLYQQGQAETAYRRFLLWQAGQVAQEVRVLFDPDTLPSRLFPRSRALQALLDRLNRPELADCWLADETVGWVYQYFNEPELQAAFEKVRVNKAKFEDRDIPSATQLFTPHWIVRFLVQNTLGRLWVQMHPDTRLIGSDLLDYLVPLQGDVPPEPLRPIQEVTLLDPACGTMHFGLVAFDLLAAMYQEELAQAGQPGWPDTPSVTDPGDIPAAIIEHNLFGIDIDLRAVQLSALALYLKAKAFNPKAKITTSNLACADVLPLNGARLGAFLKEARFSRPIYERLIRALWTRLKDVNQLGSLLRLEQEINSLIAEEKARYEQAPLFAGLPGEFEREAAEEEFWQIVSAQIVQGLDEFTRQHSEFDYTFFTGEAVKGLHLVNLMLRHYDVVVTNPPYLSRRKMSSQLAELLGDSYPEGKNDFYAAFILRNLELTLDTGYVGMLTMHSFMFISSYESLRQMIRNQSAIEIVAHCGPGLFEVGNPGTLQTAAFVFRKETDMKRRENAIGTYFRLVYAKTGDDKRLTFEQALRDGSNTYTLAQHRFDAIPGSPWVYWISESLRTLFESLSKLEEIAKPTVGLQTGENARFLRYWWEVGNERIAFDCLNQQQAQLTKKRWFPYMKGGGYRKWYGNQEYIVNWQHDGREIRNLYNPGGRLASRPQNTAFYFRKGVTWTDLGASGFSARISPGGFIFDVSGSCAFPQETKEIMGLLATMNASSTSYLLSLLNPTMHFQVGDLARLPIPLIQNIVALKSVVETCLQVGAWQSKSDESTFDLIAPLHWGTGLSDLAMTQNRLANLEAQIDDEVYRLYGLSDEDRAAIETELTGGPLTADDEAEEEPAIDDDDEETVEAPITAEELAIRWISYAVGVVLGRFRPGVAGELGSAVYRRGDFAVGSLPAPDEAEFDQLVGSIERFAYVDAQGGRHRFPTEVETALRALALPDGIAVLDEGHPRDLPALVEKALRLMLDVKREDVKRNDVKRNDVKREDVKREDITDYVLRFTDLEAPQTAEVIRLGAKGNLRKFLERDYFTKWHVTKKFYRGRPVYWPLQSAKRSYGFVIFHERVAKQTLYVLQRDYLDHKLNGLRLHIGDLQGQLESLTGAARKQTERKIDQVTQQLDEIGAFAQTLARLVREGYEPEANWIDDGVILRLAPLWELIPIWKSEPKKHWQRLQNGDFDWSHIAMHYWPARVREKCKTNKSFAIAHGLEDLYTGNK